MVRYGDGAWVGLGFCVCVLRAAAERRRFYSAQCFLTHYSQNWSALGGTVVGNVVSCRKVIERRGHGENYMDFFLNVVDKTV